MRGSLLADRRRSMTDCSLPTLRQTRHGARRGVKVTTPVKFECSLRGPRCVAFAIDECALGTREARRQCWRAKLSNAPLLIAFHRDPFLLPLTVRSAASAEYPKKTNFGNNRGRFRGL